METKANGIVTKTQTKSKKARPKRKTSLVRIDRWLLKILKDNAMKEDLPTVNYLNRLVRNALGIEAVEFRKTK
jgi:hypothetical protein